jgi:succinylarginine dihydrolase
VHYVDLRESMRNGGGPACLRLRVPLSADEWSSVTPGCRFSTDLHAGLETWVRRHYRETLAPDELGDPRLLEEGRTALDELTGILGVGSIYPFQR